MSSIVKIKIHVRSKIMSKLIFASGVRYSDRAYYSLGVCLLIKDILFFFFLHNCTFQLLDKPWSQVSSLFPPGSCLQLFIAHRVQQPHSARRIFIECCLNPRSRAFRESICAQEKVPTNFFEYALGGARTHETDLYQARG